MKTTNKIAQWLKEQLVPKKQPKLIIIMMGKKKQLLSNQWYEAGQYPDF